MLAEITMRQTAVAISAMAGGVCIALTIAISCVHYYSSGKKETTKQAVESTKRAEYESEARKAEANERLANGPTGDDFMKQAAAQDKIADAIAKQNQNYQNQLDVINKVMDAEKARRELFGI